MAKPPRELVKQIDLIQNIINGVNVLLDGNKIRVEYYGKDFLEALTEVRKLGLELRSGLEMLKSNMEHAMATQYDDSVSARFASVNNVISGFLAQTDKS